MGSISRRAAERAIQVLRHGLYHYRHRRQAKRILDHRRPASGHLPGAIKKQAEEYATEVLGWRGYSPWLQAYASVAGSFKEGWIPDNYYGRVVVPRLNGHHGRLATAKTLSRVLFDDQFLPDVAYSINGRVYNTAFEIVDLTSDACALFAQFDRIVFKRNDSLQGLGVTIHGKEDQLPSRWPDGVFQHYIHQHAALAEMSPTAVATLRLTTVAEPDGSLSVRAAYLRLGRNNEAHVQSSSHIRVPVDHHSGELDERVFLPDWTVTDRHPDTGMRLGGKIIPNFDKCRFAAIALHKKAPYVQSIGWDFAIDVGGAPVLMEWNGGHNDIKFSEAVSGPCFRDLGWEKLWRDS